MKIIQMREAGGPDVLEIGSRDIPVPSPSEVLIKVTAAGVNGPDLVQRKGFYPPPKGASDLLGLEVSGEVTAIGDAVDTLSVGDRVTALTNGGGYAEFVAVEATHCLPIPEGVDEIDAAGLPETYFTVWSNIFHNHAIPKGSTFLVHGGAGGIGSTAIQLGKAFGLKVLTTAATPEDCAFCESLGAHRAINFNDEDFVEITRSEGAASVVLDTIGGEYIARNIKASAPDGRIVQLAYNKGSKVEIDLMPVMLKRLTFTGSTLRSRPDSFKSDVAAGLREHVWPLFAAGQLKPVTYKVLPFDAAHEAHSLMESAQHKGKILLKP